MEYEQTPEEHPREEVSATASSSSHFGLIAVVLALALVALAAYAIHEHNAALALAGQSAQMSASLEGTRTQVDALIAPFRLSGAT